MPMPTVPSTKILDSAKSQVGYNVELLEGAILHVLQICGCLSAESLDRFALIYAYKHGKQLRTNFASSYLLPRMRDANKIWQVDKLSFYTASPIIKMDRQIQDAFWVFLEFMAETQLQTLSSGPVPAQITFSRQGRTYHIISVKGNGLFEFQQAIAYEMNMESYKKNGAELPEERYIITFTSMENLLNSKVKLHGKTMYCVVSYPGGAPIPSLKFVDPAKLS